MNRRMITSVVVGLLALVTVGLVLVSLRPSTPPRAPAAPITTGALAVAGNVTLRWAGPTDCNPDTDVIQLEQSVGGGSWTGVKMPLVTVYGMTFDSDNPNVGLAYGTTRNCARGVAITENGGLTWRYRSDNPQLVDASWINGRLWGIDRTTTSVVAAYDLRNHFRLVKLPKITAATVCDAQDGVPTSIAFYTVSKGMMLCEQQTTQGRLIAYTPNAAATWERVADTSPTGGLDGAGPIQDLDVAGTKSAWVLFPAGVECNAGQLRHSTSLGSVWAREPCLPGSLHIDLILDVTFTSPTQGLMLATSNGAVTMLQTSDAGKTWTPQP